MSGIDQAVVLIRRQGRGNEQQTVLASLSKVVAEVSEFRRRCGIAPVCRKLRSFDSLCRQLVRKLRCGEYEVRRRIILIKMNKVFEQSQRLVL